MNDLKTQVIVRPERARKAWVSRFDPVRRLTPESLSRQLDAFHHGELPQVARTWEAIERRDDIVQTAASKRKSAAARNGWEIRLLEDSPEARRHGEALRKFWSTIRACNAVDENERGGFRLLARQMMDAVGKRYAVHEIVWRPERTGLQAEFRFVPLWFFENRTGRLRFLRDDGKRDGSDLAEGQWLVTTGAGVMEACSVAFMYKHLPLRDWLLYCERNGMPGVRAVTDAVPGSEEWNAAREAVEAFGAEFKAVMSRGTDLEAIDLGGRGELPYPQLVERMDRAMLILWRGSDLATISRQGGVGASLQANEANLLAESDAQNLSEILHEQVSRYVIRHLFKSEPLAMLEVMAKESAQDK